MTVALPDALGAPGEPGDREKLRYVATRIAAAQRCAVEWTLRWRSVHAGPLFARIVTVSQPLALDMIHEVTRFSAEWHRRTLLLMSDASVPKVFEVTMTLRTVDTRPLHDEFARVRAIFRRGAQAHYVLDAD